MSDSFFNTPTSNDLDALPCAGKKTVALGSSAPARTEVGSALGMDFFTLDCNKSFLDLLSTHFLICNDKIKGKGEDSGFEAYTSDYGIIGAFDGCGGLGAKSCPAISDSTEAYLASRAVFGAVKQWFYSNASAGGIWSLDELKETIVEKLEVCQRHSGDTGPKLKGSMVRPFPSTIAMVRFKISDKKLVTEHIWAGDSRTYMLDKYGLAQISIDDIKGEDAMSNLTRDGALTNVISADKRFVLHHSMFIPKHPCIIFCATDGCFGYVSSPMEFEYMLLSSLVKSSSVAEWQQKLNDDIFDRSGDDQTIALAAFGFEDFEELKTYYIDRYNAIYKVVQKFEQADPEKRQLLWEAYKPNYYRHTANKE